MDLEIRQILAFDIRNASLRLALVDLATENVLFSENIPLFFPEVVFTNGPILFIESRLFDCEIFRKKGEINLVYN